MVRGRCTLVRKRKCHVDSCILLCFSGVVVMLLSTLTINMDEGLTWANLFFSDNPPEFIGELDDNPKFRSFSPDDEQWQLGRLADRARLTDASTIQVFWLLIHRRRKYAAKVVGVCIKSVFQDKLIHLQVSRLHPNTGWRPASKD